MMTDKTVRGRFVWHELMTPDTPAAHSFYSKTLGWKTLPSDQVPDYSMFAAANDPLGGAVTLPAGAPHWLSYIGTPDIDATVAQARELGAKIVKDVDDIPGIGKYAVLSDPQGAQFAVYSSTADPGREKPPKRGEFSWHELMTTDAKAALDFYSALFGWEKRTPHDMGPMGFYYLFGRNGQELGGMFDKPAEVPGGPAWLAYVRVKDVNQTVKKVKSAGGTLTNGPMEVPGGDWIAQFVDPHGAAFAVHTIKADVAASAETAVDSEQPVESEPDEPEAAPPAAKPAKKPKKVVSAAAPAKKKVVAKKVATKTAAKSPAAKKKGPPAAKLRAAAKRAKPAGKSAKATKKAAGKVVKGAKGAKAKGAPTKGSKATKKPARKK